MNLENALANLTSIPVLAFALGIIASRIKTDLSVSKGAFDSISFVLLLAIGLKGGHALKETTFDNAIAPILATLGIGILLPTIFFWALKAIRPLANVDRGAIAAHYGSTSLVTFTAALVFLDSSDVPYEGLVTTLLVAMEIPGILVGVLLAKGGFEALRNRELLREVLLGKTVLLLLGGVLLGYLSGGASYDKVKLLFVDAQPALLTLFLLTLGMKAGESLGVFRRLGAPLIAASIMFPLIGGAVGVSVGTAVGLSVGGATALGVLSASASYIAAPAAVSVALPEAKPGVPIAMSLGITFPFNLILGIPLYMFFAQLLSGLHG